MSRSSRIIVAAAQHPLTGRQVVRFQWHVATATKFVSNQNVSLPINISRFVLKIEGPSTSSVPALVPMQLASIDHLSRFVVRERLLSWTISAQPFIVAFVKR